MVVVHIIGGGGSGDRRRPHKSSSRVTIEVVEQTRTFESYTEGQLLRSRTPKQFEYDVRRAVQACVGRDIKGVRVEGPVEKVGVSGATHEFDAWYSFKIGPVTHFAAWEAKFHRRPISKELVAAFHAKLNDLRERVVGAMISANGYQKGAKTYAFGHGIYLYTWNGSQRGRPRILVENPAIRIGAKYFSPRHANTLADAFADLAEQFFDESS